MTTHVDPLSSTAPGRSRRYAGFWGRVSEARQQRRAISTLNAMPEPMLRDLGLTFIGIRDAERHGRS